MTARPVSPTLAGSRFDAVVIGASAGGVEALAVLLEALPPDFRAAVLIVQHLAPDHASLLPALLARRCARPVKEAEDKEAVQPGAVYLAPPDYHLLVEPDRSLSLSRDEPVHYSRPSIDLLFESAAMAWGERLLGIILTGASSDGAEGLRALRDAGGCAWVQDPDEAVSPTMPQAAIGTGGADAVLALAEIAAKLANLDRQ